VLGELIRKVIGYWPVVHLLHVVGGLDWLVSWVGGMALWWFLGWEGWEEVVVFWF
jgi:hypothetical protein